MRRLFTAFARNTVFANIVLVIIFMAGGFALYSLPREALPEPDLDIVLVRVVWPGADPEEVEEGICLKIEEAIEGIEGIKRYHTLSLENVGVAQIECAEGYDIDELKERVRNAVDTISTFPPDTERPIIEKSVIHIHVLFVALAGEDIGERELKEQAERIKEELRALPEISQAQVLGTREYEISIEVSEERLREYGITFGQVATLVRANCLNLPGGVMRTEGEEIRLRTIGRKYTGEEFAKIVALARPNGDNITLDRIATIRDDFTDDKVVSRFNGRPGVLIGILKTSEEDSLAIDAAVLTYIEQKQQELPGSLKLIVWGRMTTILRARIRLLVRNGAIGLALVFIMLWLFLDIRLSFWASMGMPVSIMGALVIMWVMGATINMISLFGLIMVLGIIVDDAIVVGEAVYVARKNGAPPLKATVDGILEVGMPVVAAVTTTIVAFLPLIYVSGWVGDIISILPKVVISCLSISLLECMFLLPAHLSHLPKPGAEERDFDGRKADTKPPEGWRWALMRWGASGRRFHRFTNRGLEWFAEYVYEPVVTHAIRWRYVSLSIAIMAGLAVWGIADSGLVKFEFFPDIDGNVVRSTVEFVNGTPLSASSEAVVQMEKAFERVRDRVSTASGKPVIENMFALAGARLDDVGRAERGTHWGMVRVELLDCGDRGIYFKDLISLWKEEIGTIPGAVSLTFSGDEMNIPGAPIEVWLQGDDLDSLVAGAGTLEEKLATYAGVYQIENDHRPGKNEIRLELKPEARMLGITVAHLARQIYGGYLGEEAIRLQRGRDDIRVRVRYPAAERATMASVERMRIRTPYGFEVPLLSVAEVDYGPGLADIKRTDGLRRIRVMADVDTAVANANEIVRDLNTDYLAELRRAYPDLTISFQGDQENIREAMGSVYIGFPLAIMGIFIIIATIFRSYIQPLVIMVTVPFGMIGATLGHLMMGINFSIMSVFGTVALAGIVVNDAIVLIECINRYIADGMPFHEAVRRGGVRRFRAIFLTSISTIGGLMPLILERDFQAQILIPMAVAVAAGVAFATLLTLLLEPCLLCILNDFRRSVHRLATGRWPSAEEVEPARLRNVGLNGNASGTPAVPAPARQGG